MVVVSPTLVEGKQFVLNTEGEVDKNLGVKAVFRLGMSCMKLYKWLLCSLTENVNKLASESVTVAESSGANLRGGKEFFFV